MAEEKRKGLEIPKKGDKDKIRHHGDAFFSRDSSFRRELEDEDFYKPCAYYENHQWVQKIKGNSRRAPRFTDYPEDHDIPKPQSNEIMPAVDNEVSRVARRNSEFIVEPTGPDPDKKAGAKKAEAILKDHLEKIGFPRKRRDYWFHKILYGTGGMWSFVETSYRPDKTVRIGISGALRCVGRQEFGVIGPGAFPGAAPVMGMVKKPACGLTLANDSIPMGKLDGLDPSGIVPTIKPNEQVPEGFKASRCLTCGGMLEEFDVVGEAANSVDFFGRDLGKDVPLQEANVETVTPSEMFFENEGRVPADNCTEFGVEKVKSLKWIREHFNKNLDQLSADDPMKIMERFPWQGEYSADQRGAGSVAPGVSGKRELFSNHAVVRWFWSEPDRDNPKGRLIVTAGLDNMVILEDGDLYVKDETGDLFPRMLLKTGRCFVRDGMIFGVGFARYAISDQNRINMRLSQIVQMADRMGIIYVLATKGMNLTRQWLKTLIGTILRWEPDAAVPDAKPEVKTGETQFAHALQEIADGRQSIKERLGITDAEVGQLTGTALKSGVALQIQAEKSSERRQQREQEGVHVFEAIASHQLKLIQHYYLENEGRTYRVKIGQSWEEREFKGLDISGQTDVKVKEQAGFDQTLAGKQTIGELVTENQLWATMTPYARREYLKTMGAPSAIMDEDNVQIEAAERKFQDWRQLGEVPTIDPNLDNHPVHWDTYGRLMLDNESVEMSKTVGWEKALKHLAGWEMGLMGAQQMSMMISQLSDTGGVPRDQVWAEQAPAMFAAAGRAMPPVPEAPPEALEDLIWWVWKQRLTSRGFPLPQPDPLMSTSGMEPKPSPFETFARFQAVREAHRLLMQGMAMSPMPQPAAPGTQPEPAPGAAPPPPPGPGAPDVTQQQGMV